MKINRTQGIAAIVVMALGLAVQGTASAATAWWQMCDTCNTTAKFRLAALRAQQPHEVVYVTNRNTNKTRKFKRITTWEDIEGGMMELTTVIEKSMPAREREVFRDAVANSNVTYEPLTRADLDFWNGPLGPADSLVVDLINGRLNPLITGAIKQVIQAQGLAPTVTTINETRRISTPIAGHSESTTTTRQSNLRIHIKYPDGSIIEVTMTPDLELIEWVALDIEGEIIGLKINNDGTVGINEDLFGDEYRFGPGDGVNEAVQALVDWWNTSGNSLNGTCRAVDPGPGVVGIVCPRKN